MKKALVRLLEVKNLLSIGALIVFLILALNKTFTAEQSFDIVKMVFIFFLGAQSRKILPDKEGEQ